MQFSYNKKQVREQKRQRDMMKHLVPREIEKEIFMGCCSRGSTESQILFLYNRLHKAIEILSGKQQNGLQGTEFDKTTDRLDRLSLENIVRDFAMALTGKEIDFYDS